MLLVGLRCVIVVFPDHTHMLFCSSSKLGFSDSTTIIIIYIFTDIPEGIIFRGMIFSFECNTCIYIGPTNV